MNRNNEKENKKRIKHTYKKGDKVILMLPGKQRKHNNPRAGPYTIECVNSNGTLRIQKGSISDLVNIRRVTPFFE